VSVRGSALDAEPDIEVVGETESAGHAMARGPALRPNVAVLEIRLPDGDGISVCRELRSALSPREREILAPVGDGLTKRRIGPGTGLAQRPSLNSGPVGPPSLGPLPLWSRPGCRHA
jgi:hypothetical protein